MAHSVYNSVLKKNLIVILLIKRNRARSSQIWSPSPKSIKLDPSAVEYNRSPNPKIKQSTNKLTHKLSRFTHQKRPHYTYGKGVRVCPYPILTFLLITPLHYNKALICIDLCPPREWDYVHWARVLCILHWGFASAKIVHRAAVITGTIRTS